MRIFLSYAREQGPLVNAVTDNLPPHIRPWIDQNDLLLGDDIEDSIRSAINDSTDFVVIFLDLYAVESEWVRRELRWALQREEELGRPFVLPVVVQPGAWARIEPGSFRRPCVY